MKNNSAEKNKTTENSKYNYNHIYAQCPYIRINFTQTHSQQILYLQIPIKQKFPHSIFLNTGWPNANRFVLYFYFLFSRSSFSFLFSLFVVLFRISSNRNYILFTVTLLTQFSPMFSKMFAHFHQTNIHLFIQIKKKIVSFNLKICIFFTVLINRVFFFMYVYENNFVW